MANCIATGGVVHVSGSGHSHMMAEEVSTVPVGSLPSMPCSISTSRASARSRPAWSSERRATPRSSWTRSTSARARSSSSSNSGINPVLIELAVDAGRIGATTIAITSASNYQSAKSRHSSGKKLTEVTDLTIDSHVPVSDAILTLDGLDAPVASCRPRLAPPC